MSKQYSGKTTQAMWIGIGSMCSFAFSIISSAILSRFLSKGDYGTYKQVMYVYTTLLVVFTLGLPRAYSYFLPRVDIKEGNDLVNKLNLCFISLGLSFSLCIFFGSDVISSILRNPELSRILRIFSPTPLFLLPTMGLDGVMSTYRKTIWSAVYTILTRTIMILFVALPVAFYKANVETAVWGFTISSIFSCIIALYFKKIPFKGVVGVKTNILLSDIFKFSLPLMFAGFWGIAEKAADQFFISHYFGTDIFAEFSNGWMELPFMGMVLGAGGAVLLPVFSKMVVSGEDNTIILDLWRRTAVKAAFILYPLIIFFFIFAEPIMTILYGDLYSVSAKYFRIKLLLDFFMVAQYYPIVLALGKTNYYSNVHLFVAILVWIGEYLFVSLTLSPFAVAYISVLCRLIKILFMMNLIATCINVPLFKLFPLSQLAKVFISCACAGMLSYYIVSFFSVIDVQLVSIVIAFIIYCGLVIIVGKIIKIDYYSLIRPIITKIVQR